MIIDTLDHLDRYRAMSPLMDLAIAFLRERAADAADGRHVLSGDDAFASVETYVPQPAETKRWEAHRRYTDLQVVLAGVELMGYAPLASLTVAEAYDEARDLTWLTGQGSVVRAAAGTFVIFQPWDAHMPGIAADADEGAARVRKVVFKLAAASFGESHF